jgi:hypothetical protein
MQGLQTIVLPMLCMLSAAAAAAAAAVAAMGSWNTAPSRKGRTWSVHTQATTCTLVLLS